MADDEAIVQDLPVEEPEPRGLTLLKQFWVFLRSVIPEDPWQLLFLAGLVCLTVSPKLRWWPASDAHRQASRQAAQQLGNYGWYGYFILASLVTISGAASGYGLCFWRSRRLVRRIVLTVCLPPALAMLALLAWDNYWETTGSSILESNWNVGDFVRSLPHSWNNGPGFHFCVIGILLVGWFALRVWLGLSTLPLTLPQKNGTSGETLGQRPKITLWLSIGPQVWILGVPFVFLGLMLPTASGKIGFAAWFAMSSLMQFALVLWLIGEEGRQAVRPLVRFPNLGWIGLAIAVPVCFSALFSTGWYLYDRIHWAAFDFRRLSPPDFLSYIPLPKITLGATLLIAAATEEVIFRGMLQPLFSREYGVKRGVFLATMAWAAYHFYSDGSARSHVTDLDVFIGIISRALVCFAIGYVLSWLTIRSNSLVPPIMAHALYNVMNQADRDVSMQWEPTVGIALWAVLALILFWRWPITLKADDGMVQDVTV